MKSLRFTSFSCSHKNLLLWTDPLLTLLRYYIYIFGGDLTNNCPLQLLMTYQSARNTPKNPMHWATSRRRASYIMTSAQRPLMAHANVTRISLKLCIIFLTSPPHSAASAAISARRSTDVYFKDFQAVTVAVVGADGEIWATMGTCGSC